MFKSLSLSFRFRFLHARRSLAFDKKKIKRKTQLGIEQSYRSFVCNRQNLYIRVYDHWFFEFNDIGMTVAVLLSISKETSCMHFFKAKQASYV